METKPATAFDHLTRAKDAAAREVLRRQLKGLRAEITERALVDHYHQKFVTEARAQAEVTK